MICIQGVSSFYSTQAVQQEYIVTIPSKRLAGIVSKRPDRRQADRQEYFDTIPS